MMLAGRRRLVWLPIAVFVTGCASPRESAKPEVPSARVWSGRLSLEVETEPRQTFFASFELAGTAEYGELTLSTAFGNVLAAIQWRPGEARLSAGQDTKRFDSVESLTRHVTGAALPLRAMIDWLNGAETSVTGWEADFTQLDEGRLSARRSHPMPAANLKLILDDTGYDKASVVPPRP